tara:strand:+ start:80 stop:277 length:198 start_codon:yes stop_codon:yes gene_type:complete
MYYIDVKIQQLDHLYEKLYLNNEGLEDPYDLLRMIVEELPDPEFEDVYLTICETYGLSPISKEIT